MRNSFNNHSLRHCNADVKYAWFRKTMNEFKDEFNEQATIFHTEETQENGNIIIYFHERPKLKESNLVWRLSEYSLSVSEDGGKTYKATIISDNENVWIRGGSFKKASD